MSSVAKKKASSSKAKKKESSSESKKKATSSESNKVNSATKAPSSSKAKAKVNSYSKANSKENYGPKAKNAIIDCAADVEDDQANILIQNPYYCLRSAYDMSYVPEDYCCTFYRLPDSMDKKTFNDLCRFSKLAIQQYNSANKTKYEFVQVLGRLMALVAGFVWYITFEAKQAPNDSPATFQTLVYDGIPDHTIEFVRMISSPSKEVMKHVNFQMLTDALPHWFQKFEACDSKGAVVAGDKNKEVLVRDIWVFEKSQFHPGSYWKLCGRIPVKPGHK